MNQAQQSWVAKAGRILTHEYFPTLDPYLFGWARTPLGTLGLAATAAALCGIFLHPHAFILLFAIVLVVLLGLLWPWLSMRGLSGTITFPPARIREGDTVTVS